MVRTLKCVVVLCAAFAAALAAEASRVPLREGLTIVSAVHNANGDSEAISTITHVEASSVTVAVSSDEPADTCPGRRSSGLRIVQRDDLERARAFRHEFAACPSAPERQPGTTAI